MKTFSLAQNLKSANENAAKGLPISVSIEWAESFEIQKFRKNIVLLVANFTLYTNIKMQNFEGFNTYYFILTPKTPHHFYIFAKSDRKRNFFLPPCMKFVNIS